MDSISWQMSWREQDIASVIVRFLVMLFLPGFFLLLWSIAEPSGGWVMTFPLFALYFLFFPYAVILTIVFVYRLFTGGTEHTAALSLSRGDDTGGVYRIDSQWSINAYYAGELRKVSFSPQDLEGFAKELIGDSDPLAPWCRIVAWRKRQTPQVLFEKVPRHIADAALDWLHEKTGTRPPIF
jgi:hypothetical protein